MKFSSSTTVLWHLNSGRTKQEMLDYVMLIPYGGGGTKTGKLEMNLKILIKDECDKSDLIL